MHYPFHTILSIEVRTLFYRYVMKDYVRVPPHLINREIHDSLRKALEDKFLGMNDRELGTILAIGKIENVGEGIVISGDGGIYYPCDFEVFAYKPLLQEVVIGRILDITEFGAFISLGPFDGMIHISQCMNDVVTFSKSQVLTGKNTKKTLKIGDVCFARIIAISLKDILNPRIGLTMRQPYLGKEDWWENEKGV
ncbi:MAG: DNA-directed RNA polymerase [Candidatus Woesearchaeota archaeon]